jgi:hypothetical protein
VFVEYQHRYIYSSSHQIQDGPSIALTRAMFYGYDALVWTIIVIYALGGLTAAMAMKHADNILKVAA